MLNTIYLIGDREKEKRAILNTERKRIESLVSETYGQSYLPFFTDFFFVSTPHNNLGSFNTQNKTISLSTVLLDTPLSDLKNVFLHEASHALDYRKNGFCSDHNSKQFKDCCAFLGVDAGFDKARVALNKEKEEKTKEKIEKLLRLSSSPYSEEASSALSKAQELLVKNSLQDSNSSNNEHDEIYYTPLFSAKRIPYYIVSISSFIELATGVSIIKDNRSPDYTEMRAFGTLDQVESALYIYSYLDSSLTKELEKLRKEGKNANKKEFIIGAIPKMKARLKNSNSNITNQIMVINQENKEKAGRLVYNAKISTKSVHAKYNQSSSSFLRGQEFGEKADWEKNKKKYLS